MVKPNTTVHDRGDLLVAIDPKLQINQCLLPLEEEIFVSLMGGKTFSEVDL